MKFFRLSSGSIPRLKIKKIYLKIENEDIDKTCNKKKKLPKVFALKRIGEFLFISVCVFYIFKVNIPVDLIDKINHLIANNQQQQQHCSFIVSP